MRQVKYIEISTENCELFRFTQVGNFNLENITKQIVRTGCNMVGEYLACERASIEIFADDNKYENNVSVFKYGEPFDLFERIIKYNDITSIDVTFTDGSKEEIYVPYEDTSGGLGESNNLQCSYMNKFGDLYIAIGRTEEGNPMKIEDVFDLENIEDQEYIEFHKDITDILDN